MQASFSHSCLLYWAIKHKETSKHFVVILTAATFILPTLTFTVEFISIHCDHYTILVLPPIVTESVNHTHIIQLFDFCE